MSSSRNLQTAPVPPNQSPDVRIDVRINMRVDVHIHVDDGPEHPAGEPSRGQSQQSEREIDGEDEQTEAGVNAQKGHPETQTSAPIVLSKLALRLPSWPAGGFADDDPATVNMFDILYSFEFRSVMPSAAEDFIIFAPKQPRYGEKRVSRPIDHLSRFGMANGRNYNFFSPNAARPGEMVGKFDFSKTCLTIILQALRSVVGIVPFPPQSQHVDRLNAANGAIKYARPRYWEAARCYSASVNPFTLEGVRTAAAVLQAAARDSSSGHVLFVILSVPDALLTTLGQSEACLAAYPEI